MEKITATSPLARSKDLLADNVAKLRALFPELVTESEHGHAVNVDVLKQLVGDATVTDADEKYGLNWHGKRAARKLALTPSAGTLRPAKEESVDWDTTQNLMIEGDNLEVLKLLQKSYAGKIKMIYIDPPYNTGNDFIYDDNFKDPIGQYRRYAESGSDNLKLTSNPKSSGQFHTRWLDHIYPRIRILHRLLSSEGVLFMSIDDNEVHNALELLSQVFGYENLIGILIHQRAKGGGNAKTLVKGHDYCIVFAKDKDKSPPLTRAKVVQGKVETIDGIDFLINDDIIRKKFGKYDKEDGDRRCFHEQLSEYKSPDQVAAIQQKIDSGTYFLKSWDNGMHAICERTRLSDARSKLYSIMKYLSELGTADLEALDMAETFSYPKPRDFVKAVMDSVTSSGDIVLDAYAGSGTSGDAVYSLNLDTGRGLRYIAIQVPFLINESDEVSSKAKAFCVAAKLPLTIASLTEERLRRAAAKLKAENPNYTGDLGFRVFKLDTSNHNVWDPDADDLEQTLLSAADAVKPNRSDDDLLYELLLKLGLDLCAPIQTVEIGAHTVHAVGAGTLFVCLDRHITPDGSTALGEGIAAWREQLAPLGESTAVFRDSAFHGSNVAKVNLTQTLQQRGIENVRSL